MKLLFTPAKIGKLELKNRLVMPAMATGFGSLEGQVTERMVRYYEERAKGGVGLIVVEIAAIDPGGRALPAQLMANNDRFVKGLRKLAETIKTFGARAAIQLHHAGVRGSAISVQTQPVGPSDLPDCSTGTGPHPRGLTLKEISKLVLAFGDAARRIQDAGFDAIEIHCTHSYLIDQFMSPRFNQRTDAYGGSVKNRARFALEIIECARARVGKDYPIICRITGDEFVKGGITIEEAKMSAKLFVDAGANCISVSVGVSDFVVPNPPMSFSDGCFLHLSEAIKKEIDVPVIGVGKISNPELAERALSEGKADLIAMGRALIADPYLPEKTKNGRLDDIVPCIYCNQGCVTRVLAGLDITCLVNPAVGKEMDFEVYPAKVPKKVLVVGGGPAGLETAIVSKRRGHNVVIAERKDRLGGQLYYASKPPDKEKIAALVEYFLKQLRKLGVKTYLNRCVNKEFVQEINPNVIVMATGSTPIVPQIVGVNLPNVFIAIDILDRRQEVRGNEVIVIGGGQVGLETADFLSSLGKKVTVIEMLSEVGTDIPVRTKKFLMNKLSGLGVRILVNRKVEEVFEHGVRVNHFGQREEFDGDAIILAVGSKPERALLEELKEIIPDLDGFYMVGDCIEPRKALEAIYEAARVGIEI